MALLVAIDKDSSDVDVRLELEAQAQGLRLQALEGFACEGTGESVRAGSCRTRGLVLGGV